ncbi:LPXTG cell wall anchor domain-containing protein [Weissella tructae]
MERNDMKITNFKMYKSGKSRVFSASLIGAMMSAPLVFGSENVSSDQTLNENVSIVIQEQKNEIGIDEQSFSEVQEETTAEQDINAANGETNSNAVADEKQIKIEGGESQNVLKDVHNTEDDETSNVEPEKVVEEQKEEDQTTNKLERPSTDAQTDAKTNDKVEKSVQQAPKPKPVPVNDGIARKDISHMLKTSTSGKNNIKLNNEMIMYVDKNNQLRMDINLTTDGGVFTYESELRIRMNDAMRKAVDNKSIQITGGSLRNGEDSTKGVWNDTTKELVLKGDYRLFFGLSIAFIGDVPPEAALTFEYSGKRIWGIWDRLDPNTTSMTVQMGETAHFVNKYFEISKKMAEFPSWYPSTKMQLNKQLESSNMNSVADLERFESELQGHAQKDALRELQDANLTQAEKEVAEQNINNAMTLQQVEENLKEIREKSVNHDIQETESTFDNLDALTKHDRTFLDTKMENFLSDYTLDKLTRSQAEEIEEFLNNLRLEAIDLNGKSLEALGKEKEEAIDKLDDLINLTNPQKDGFIERITDANSIGEVRDALRDANKENEKQRQKSELEAARKDALKEMEKLEHLQRKLPNVYEEHLDKILDSNSINEINEIVDKMQQLNKDMKDFLEEALNAIDTLEYLDEAEKNSFKERLQERNVLLEMLEIVGEGVRLNEERRVSKQLEEIKGSALNELKSFTELNSDDLLEFEDAIRNAETADDVHKKMDEVVLRNQLRESERLQRLSDAQNEARKDVEALTDLSDDERNAFKDRINKQKDIQGVKDVQNEAEQLNQSKREKREAIELQELKRDAADEINNLQHFDKEDLDDWHKQLEDAKKPEEVESILEDAKDESQKRQNALNEAQVEGSKKIQALPNFNETDQEIWHKKLEDAKTPDDVNKIVEDAKKENQKRQDALDEARKNGSEEIKDLPHFDKQELEDLQKKLDEAKTPDEANKIAEDAKKESQKRQDALDEARKNGSEGIKDLPHFDKQELEDLQKKLDEAKTPDEAKKIVEDAKKESQKRQDALDEAHKNGSEGIKDLPHFDKQELEDLQKKLDESKTPDDAKKIVEDAKKESQKRQDALDEAQRELEDARKNGSKEIKDLPHFDKQELEDLQKKLDEAKTPDEAKKIAEDAKKESQKRQDALDEARKNGLEEIKDLPHFDKQELEDLQKKLDDAKTPDEANKIAEDAKKESHKRQDALDEARKNGSEGIKDLPHFDKQELEDLQKKLDDAKTPDDAKKIVEDAKKESQKRQDAIDEAQRELEDARKNGSEEIKDLPHFDKQELEDLQKKLDESKTPDDAKKIVEDAKDESQKRQDALDEARKNGLDEIKDLPHLDKQEQEDLQKKLDESKTPDDVNKIVEDAKKESQKRQDALDEAQRELEDARKNGSEEIKDLPHFDKQELEDLQKKLDDAKTPDDAKKIVEDAKKESQKRQDAVDEAQRELEDARKNGSEEIKDLPHFDKQELEDLQKKLDESNTPDDVNKIVEDAKDESQKRQDAVDEAQRELEDARKNGSEEIKDLPHFDKQELEDLQKKLDESKTPDDAKKIVEDAKKESQKRQDALDEAQRELEDARKNGSEEIKDLPHFDKQELEDLQKKLDESKTPDDVNKIVEDAKDESQKRQDALDEARKNGLDEIKDLPHFDKQEQEDLQKKLDESKTPDDVNKIVEDAKKESQKRQDAIDEAQRELEDARKNGSEEIDGLPNLSDDEKNDFKKQLDDASTLDEIKGILNDAVQKNHDVDHENQGDNKVNDILEFHKEESKKQIESLDHLTEAEKNGINQRIDEAVSADELHDIVEEAEHENQKRQDALDAAQRELDDARKNGSEEIKDLPHFDKQEQEDLQKKLDESKTLDDVKKIVEDAKKESQKRQDAIDEAQRELDDARKNGLDEIKDLPHFEKQEQEDLQKKLDEAKTPDDVKKIVEDAKKESQKRQDSMDEAQREQEERNDNRSARPNGDVDDLNAHKDEAVNEVRTLPQLNKQEKQDIQRKISDARSVKEINDLMTELPNTASANMNAGVGLSGLALLFGTFGTYFRRKKND